MSAPRLAVTVILGITTITAAGLAYYQYQRADSLTQALAQATSNARDLPAATPPTVAFAESIPTPAIVEESNARDAEEETEATEEDRNNERRGFDRAAFGSRIQALMADPEYAQAFQKQQRSRLDGPYANLFAQLNLPPATLGQLQDLLVEKQNAARDVFMAAREEGFSGRDDRDQLRELLQITQDEIDAQIRETIGDQNFTTLESYEDTGPQRALVDSLETRLSYSSTPLNSAQAQALTLIIAETTSPVSAGRGGRSSGVGVSRGNVTITDDTISRAQSVLSPDQLQSLVTLQEEQAAAAQISQIMRREAQAARGSEGGGVAPLEPAGGG